MNFIAREDYLELLKRAGKSPRKRYHKLLHESKDDLVQRLIIAMKKGTYIPPHYHSLSHQWEMFVAIQGEVEYMEFSNQGMLVTREVMAAGEILEIKPNTIHTILCKSTEAIILEIKQGPFFESEAKVTPNWSLSELELQAHKFYEMLENLNIGEYITTRFNS